MDDPLLIAGIAVAVLGGGIAAFFLLRIASRKRELRQWQEAWHNIKSAPEDALTVFRNFIRKLRGRPQRAEGIRRPQAHLGAALCLIRLRRFDDAVGEEEKARDGTLSEKDERLLCEAWLDANPQPPPVSAIEAYARYLTSPGRETALERRADDALRAALRVPADGEADLQLILELARRILALLPMRDEAQFALGLALGRLGRWREAISPLEIAVDAEPGSADRRVTLARAYREGGEELKARAAYLDTYRLDPSAFVAREAGLLCAKLADKPFNPTERLAAGDRSPLEMAATLLQQAANLDPNDPRVWPELARTLARLGRFSEAAPALERAVAVGPASAEDLFLLAQCRIQLHQHAEARQALDQALRAEPNHKGAARLAGDLAYDAGAFVDAFAYYQRLGPPSDTPLAEKVARCSLEANRPADAVKLLADRSPLSQHGRLVLGRAHARLGDWGEALDVLQGGDLAGASPTYRYYLANAFAATGQHAEAEKLFEALCDDPNLGARARRYLGHTKVLSRDFDGAEMCYKAAGVSSLEADLGRLCLLRSQPAEAKSHFERMLAAAPASRTARLGAAVAAVDLGDVGPLTQLANDPEMAQWAGEPLGDQAYEDRNYVEALAAYELAFKGRRRIPSRALARMAVGYLHLGHFPQALPHLVELTRRHPQVPDVRYNLALCRYQIGRQHFQNQRWDPARGEFSRCDHLLKAVAPTEAEGIHRWEAEAAYRAAAAMLASDPPQEPDRAARLFEEGTKGAPAEARWWVGAALAAAATGQHGPAAERFGEAQRRAADRPGLAFGEGLSLQAAGRHSEAVDALGRALKLGKGEDASRMTIALRIALAGSHAALKNYAKAADELRPLLDDPRVRASKSYTTADVAKAMVAYYALAGNRDRAAELARTHLPGESVGSLVVALVQVESADFAGAAQTLRQAYENDKSPGVKKLLVGCLLKAAAECVRKKDPRGATSLVRQALEFDPTSKEAKRLDAALEFGRRMKDLDPKKLDEAIKECEGLVNTPDAAGQLIRTLGVLYHRRALQSERNAKGAGDLWEKCVGFWRQRVFGDEGFWKRFVEEYNAGKGKREQIKPDEIGKWRQELPAAFARSQGALLAEALKSGDRKAAERHLGLIWEWDPEFEPPKDLLGPDLKVDDEMARVLENVQKKVKSKSAQQFIMTMLAGWWNQKGLKVLDEVARENREGIEKGNEAGRINGISADLFNKTLEEFNRSASGGVPSRMVDALLKARAVLQVILEKMREAVGLVDKAKGHCRKALGLLGDCRKNLKKAREMDPDTKVYAENEKTVNDIESKISENVGDFDKLANTINENTKAVRSNLTELESLCRRIGM